MSTKEIMAELKSLGSDSLKKILLKHGVKEPFFAVKIEHLKVIEKRIKKDYALALALYDTKNADAMYLAGLITDDEKMTKNDLTSWVKLAVSDNISGYTVPWVAAGGKFGFELALDWIDDKQEHIVAAGWATLSGLMALKPDNELPIPTIKKLLSRIEKNIHTSKNREKSGMNNFIISVGSYVKDLSKEAITLANKIGPITIDTNGTACKVPNAADYIKKVIDRGNLGKKKKTIKC